MDVNMSIVIVCLKTEIEKITLLYVLEKNIFKGNVL